MATPAVPRGANPFDSSGVEQDRSGVRRYTNLYESILAMLGESVEAEPRGAAQTSVDQWLHTGGIGRVDPSGLVYVLDRMKDMINRGGENVYCVDYAREHLADFKVPQFIAVRSDPLPRNPNGKVQKARLRETDFGASLFS